MWYRFVIPTTWCNPWNLTLPFTFSHIFIPTYFVPYFHLICNSCHSCTYSIPHHLFLPVAQFVDSHCCTGPRLILKQHIFLTQLCVLVNYELSIIYSLMNSAWWGVCMLVWLPSWENVMEWQRSLLNNASCLWGFIYITDYRASHQSRSNFPAKSYKTFNAVTRLLLRCKTQISKMLKLALYRDSSWYQLYIQVIL